MARETLIQVRRGGISSWSSAAPVLAAGEFGYAEDVNSLRIGDGSKTFGNLGVLANTAETNSFRAAQVITPKRTSEVSLQVYGAMKRALITTATINAGGTAIEYTYLTDSTSWPFNEFIVSGDFVVISGFANTSFNTTATGKVVTAYGGGAGYATFTIANTGTPNTTVTGTSSTWFYERNDNMADAFKVTKTIAGGTANTDAYSSVFKVNGQGDTVIGGDLTFAGTTLGMRLNSATYFSTSRITGTATTSASGTAMLESKAATSAAHYHQFFSHPSVIIGRVRTESGTTYFETVSDYRLKENIVPIEDAVEKVKELKPSRFNFKSVPGVTIDGFIAHETAEVVPMAVGGEKDAVDENGNPEYQSMDASKLIPILTAALQDALKRIEVLEKKVK